MLLSTEGRAGEAYNPSKKAKLFRKSGSLIKMTTQSIRNKKMNASILNALF